MYNEEYISPQEASRLLGYEGTGIIYELYHTGEISGYQRKNKAKIFISKKSVLEYRDRLIKRDI